jgi:hypothetical protein
MLLAPGEHYFQLSLFVNPNPQLPGVIPWNMIHEEVNIVPSDLDFFVSRNETCKANYNDWESPNPLYKGQLLVVPV